MEFLTSVITSRLEGEGTCAWNEICQLNWARLNWVIELVPQVKTCSVITLVICPKMATASFSNLPTRAFSPSYHNRHQSFVINNITRQIPNPHLINFSLTCTSSTPNKNKTCRPTVIFASGGGKGGGGSWGSGGGGGGGDDDAGFHNCTEAIFALAKVSSFLVRNVYVFHRKFNKYVLILCLYLIRVCCIGGKDVGGLTEGFGGSNRGRAGTRSHC